MRDIVLTLALLMVMPLILGWPHVGVLSWAWVSFMNPHKEVYSYLQDANLNFFIAIITIVGLIFSTGRRIPKFTPVLVVILLFTAWTTVTTFTALNFDMSYEYWLRNVKTVILLIAIAIIIDRPSRLHSLMLVIVISLGYWAAVSAIQTVASLGHAQLQGPHDSMIADNNQLALALVIVLPVVEYCRYVSDRQIVRTTLIAAMSLFIIAILGSYSRGGLIALVTVLICFWLKSRNRLVATSVILVCIATAMFVLPQKWNDRMSTIETYQSDESFQGRLRAWKVAIRIGLDRPVLGAGFRATEDPKTYSRYKSEEDTTKFRAVHDAYLQVLAEHGFVGLSLFATMLFLAFRNCRWVAKNCSGDQYWLAYLAGMLETAFIGYAVGGIALSVAYYDVFLVFIVVSSIIKEYAQQETDALSGIVEEGHLQTIPTARV